MSLLVLPVLAVLILIAALGLTVGTAYAQLTPRTPKAQSPVSARRSASPAPRPARR